MAQWDHQSSAAYTDGGTVWTIRADGDFVFTLSDGEVGGADALTFEVGDILDDGFFISGDLLYVGTLEYGGETFIVGERTSSGELELYSTQPLQSPSQFPPTVDPADINTAAFTVCFAAGTQIATPTGQCRVEDLCIGDPVLTSDGRTVPVRWLGRQTVMPAFGPAERLLPVKIAANALADQVPFSDLVVSADHGMVVDGMIVHAAALVNGETITREMPDDLERQFTYWHVETEEHEILIANGAPAETYIDNVSRAAFDNHAEFLDLYGIATPAMTELDLPRVVTARQVPASLRERLAARASRRGPEARAS